MGAYIPGLAAPGRGIRSCPPNLGSGLCQSPYVGCLSYGSLTTDLTPGIHSLMMNGHLIAASMLLVCNQGTACVRTNSFSGVYDFQHSSSSCRNHASLPILTFHIVMVIPRDRRFINPCLFYHLHFRSKPTKRNVSQTPARNIHKT